jgi:hypothetical protein
MAEATEKIEAFYLCPEGLFGGFLTLDQFEPFTYNND